MTTSRAFCIPSYSTYILPRRMESSGTRTWKTDTDTETPVDGVTFAEELNSPSPNSNYYLSPVLATIVIGCDTSKNRKTFDSIPLIPDLHLASCFALDENPFVIRLKISLGIGPLSKPFFQLVLARIHQLFSGRTSSSLCSASGSA